MCGVLGIFDNKSIIERLYNGMLTLQHRGQDSAGMLTYDGRFHLKRGNGLVRDIFDQRNISRLTGNIGIGHTRYPTVGEGSVEDAQPFWINFPFGIGGAHNGNVTNFLDLKDELLNKHNRMINSNCDLEAIINIFALYIERFKSKMLTPEIIFGAVRYIYSKVKGSYSVILNIAGYGMLGFRDPYGLRPLLIGKKRSDGVDSYAMASESVALNMMEFEDIEDVSAGEAIFIDKNHRIFRRKVLNKPFRPCIFEYIYFARPDSYMNQINVDSARVELGKNLAKKIKKLNLDIDVVVPVPDSARGAAIEIARLLKIKYREGLVKNRYIGRTFIMPGDKLRKESIRHKLNPIKEVLKGKNVLLVDDSIVRGNTSRSIIQMVRGSGANKVYFASYSSPLTNPCVYGIDMQTKSEFIAANHSNEEIAFKLGADLVIYQDLEEMNQAVRKQNKKIKTFCNACFTGYYPTKDVSKRILEKIEEERDRCNSEKPEKIIGC